MKLVKTLLLIVSLLTISFGCAQMVPRLEPGEQGAFVDLWFGIMSILSGMAAVFVVFLYASESNEEK